jgi:hypothetical protein
MEDTEVSRDLPRSELSINMEDMEVSRDLLRSGLSILYNIKTTNATKMWA